MQPRSWASRHTEAGTWPLGTGRTEPDLTTTAAWTTFFPQWGVYMFKEATPVPSLVRVWLVWAQGATLAAAGWRQCLVPVAVVSILIEVSTHETQPPPSQQPQ